MGEKHKQKPKPIDLLDHGCGCTALPCCWETHTKDDEWRESEIIKRPRLLRCRYDKSTNGCQALAYFQSFQINENFLLCMQIDTCRCMTFPVSASLVVVVVSAKRCVVPSVREAASHLNVCATLPCCRPSRVCPSETDKRLPDNITHPPLPSLRRPPPLYDVNPITSKNGRGERHVSDHLLE